MLADTTVPELVRQMGGDAVTVASADPARLRGALAGPGVEITGRPGSEELSVTGMSARDIGIKAAEHGIALFELTTKSVSLEEAYMALTQESVEYHSTNTGLTGLPPDDPNHPGADLALSGTEGPTR